MVLQGGAVCSVALALYMLGLKTSVVPTSIWYSQTMCQ
jgi:hypothetical protein